MTVYAIRNDGYKFQQLDLELDDIIDSRPDGTDENIVLDFSIENCAMADWWPTPDTEFLAIDEDENAAIPDISKWIDASLVLSAKAFRLLGDLLKPWGELLPVTVRGESFYIFNCLTFARIDEERAERVLYEGQDAGIKSMEFDDNDIKEKLIFKSTYNSCMEIYCTERFKSVVEDYRIEGIIFSKELVESFN